MNRRRFVGTLTAASLASSPLIEPRRARSQSPAGGGRISYAPIHFLTTDAGHVDARPTFSPDGSEVLFMRNVPTAAQSSFYVVKTWGGPAVPFIPRNLPPGLSLTRPDWSWHRSSYPIVFNGTLPATQQAPAQSNIYLLDDSTRTIECVLQGFVDKYQVYSYPSWYPDGVHASITNYYYPIDQDGFSTSPNPRMELDKLDIRNGRLTALTDPDNIWPGMSSVAQCPAIEDPPIAFAGMTPESAQNPVDMGRYNQNENQIWLRLPGGRLDQVQNLQGRAPWWSPNGRFLAFESNRLSPSYQIFVQDPYIPQIIAPVTPPGLYVMHAKWAPGATKLVFAYSHGEGTWGIAYIDLF
jgi:Tol biopolymer transport system component